MLAHTKFAAVPVPRLLALVRRLVEHFAAAATPRQRRAFARWLAELLVEFGRRAGAA